MVFPGACLLSVVTSLPCVADTDGFVKVLSDAQTDRVLGVHIIGSVSPPILYG